MQRSTTSREAAPENALRRLPALSRLLDSRAAASFIGLVGRELAADLLREQVEERRRAIVAGELAGPDLRRATSLGALVASAELAAAGLLCPRPATVINATGVVVHTNLGRSLLSDAAAQRVADAARTYVDLEYDVAAGRRGSRMSPLEPLMARLFPGHDFLVVNNNAAAILLCLRALARGREVLVSRGELVEIGGSFRVPDILSTSGARLREVGTTNRTRRADYAAAIGSRSALLLKVHTSNFKIIGFTEETSIPALAELAGSHGLPLVVDWGSGDLVDLRPLGIDDELPVRGILDAGADLVTFSGDKLLGGPQAGFVVGRPELVRKLRRDPLARVCRLDRVLIAALHETLAAYVRGSAWEDVPTLRMLALTAHEIGRRAKVVAERVARAAGGEWEVDVIDGVSRTGGGSSPTGERPTRLVRIGRSSGDAGGLERQLRSAGDPPVIARLHDGRLLLDLRTVLEEQDEQLALRLTEAIGATR